MTCNFKVDATAANQLRKQIMYSKRMNEQDRLTDSTPLYSLPISSTDQKIIDPLQQNK